MRIAVARAAFAGAVVASIAATGGARATDLYVEPPYAGTYGAPPAAARIEALPPAPVYAEPVYAPPPAVVVPVVPGPVVEERCRVRYKRAFDAYGREVVRRIRICDEGVVDRYAARPPYAAEPLAPPRYGEYAPRPPANVGEGYRSGAPYVPGYREPPPDRGERDDAPPQAWDDNAESD